MDMGRLTRAIEVATDAHRKQLRKGTDVPYITHPYAVGMFLAQLGCPEDVVIAGVLHDTVEDTSLTLGDIRKVFGVHVAEIVEGCSEPDKAAEWKERKRHTIHFLESTSQEIKLVSCADKLHNITSMIKDYGVLGENLWSRFNEGPCEQEWYYRSLAEVFAKDAHFPHPLSELFSVAVQTLFDNRVKD